MARTLDSTKESIKRIRLRFLVLVPLIIACALISRAHIISVGSRYEMTLNEYSGVALTEENFSFDPPQMMRVVSVEQDEEGASHVVFEAGEPGKGICLVNVPDGGGMFEMATTADGVIVANGFEVTGWRAVFISLVAVISCLAVLCASAVVSLVRRSWYGYEMAAYCGGALFFASQAVQFIGLYLGGRIYSFATFAIRAIVMADNFLEVSLIPMAILAILVSVSNAALMRYEGKGFGNMLGILASLFGAAAFFGLRFFQEVIDQLLMNSLLSIIFSTVLSALYAYFMALFLGVCITALLAAHHMPSFPRSHIIILGCGLRADGTPTPLLAGRVDAALSFAGRQVSAGHDAPTFVPSGGQGSDEACSEACSMGRYIDQHDPAARVLLEDRSTTTRENMAFSARVIADDAPSSEQRIAFATTNYHVLRGYVFAHQAGMEAEGIASPTKLYFWPNAFLREFVGMLAARALPILMTCLSIITLYGFLEFLLLPH